MVVDTAYESGVNIISLGGGVDSSLNNYFEPPLCCNDYTFANAEQNDV